MSTHTADRARQPKGRPTGGQFAEENRASSGLSLTPAPSSLLGHDYQVDESWPQPQANDLEKVGAVVDAISNGANTNAAVGHALDLSEREGAYYAAAAGYLGLVEKDHSTDGDLTVLVPPPWGTAWSQPRTGTGHRCWPRWSPTSRRCSRSWTVRSPIRWPS